MVSRFLPVWALGEFIGTFLLVFFGCGCVAAAVLTGAQVGIFQVAIVWGLGIAIAIYLTAHLSGAHLNPAVTLALTAFRSFPRRRVAGYVSAQLLGAFAASALILLLFSGTLERYEHKSGIVRGTPGSEATAMIFGEFYPNPAGKPLIEDAPVVVGGPTAFLVELTGTAILVLTIFGLTDQRNTSIAPHLVPVFIGLTVTLLISLFAPLTMAGFNPARDFAPRVLSALAGWKTVPFSVNGWGWLTVYIVGPLLGGLLGAGIYCVIGKLRNAQIIESP